MDWENVLKHYKESERITDDELLDEAIATCEHFFETMDTDKLMHRSRPLVLSYLALKEERRKKD